MNTIQKVQIHETWQRVAVLDADAARGLFDRLTQDQPVLLEYLANEEEPEEGSEEQPARAGALLFSGIVAIETFRSSAVGNLRPVTPQEVMNAEARNLAYLEELETASDESMGAGITVWLQKHNQGLLLESLLAAVLENQNEDPDGEFVGVALLRLKTVVDCLDAIPGVIQKPVPPVPPAPPAAPAP